MSLHSCSDGTAAEAAVEPVAKPPLHPAQRANAARRYTSQVTIEEPLKVISRVSDSTLFDHLDTTWEFAGGPTPDSCWLTFSIDFAFKSPLYGQLASIFFQEVSVMPGVQQQSQAVASNPCRLDTCA